MKKAIIGAVLLIVAALLIWGVYITNNKEVATPELEQFMREVQLTGVERIGAIPVEGFDGFLLLSAFSTLKESDFHGVTTLEGIYLYENGELRYERTSEQPVTSAEQMITQGGYQVLLENVSKRLGIENISEVIERVLADEA